MKSLRTFLRLGRSPNTLRRFATAEARARQNEQAEQGEHADNAHEQTADYDSYETYNQRSLFSRLFRAFMWSSLSLTALHTYYGYADNFDLEVSRQRTIFLTPFYRMILAIRSGFSDFYDLLVSPPVARFLPDQPPIRAEMHLKTLVLNLEGTLLAKDFEAGAGTTLHLRPDLVRFLQEVSKMYEIVIYANEDNFFLTEAIQTIDPMNRYVRWVFGRDYFAYSGTKLVKDLRRLNRDPRKVIVVDVNTDAYPDNNVPENLILLKPYNAELTDDTLLVLRRFLMQMSNPEVRDVRKEIKRYGGVNALEAYRTELQQKLDRLNRSKSFFGMGRKAPK